jgi:hypothetical protein
MREERRKREGSHLVTDNALLPIHDISQERQYPTCLEVDVHCVVIGRRAGCKQQRRKKRDDQEK